MLYYSTIALILGYVLDAVLGDPQGWPHIVRGIGALISALERRLYPMEDKRKAGLYLVIAVVAVSALVPSLVLVLAWLIHPLCYMVVEAVLCWQVLAVKSLKTESRRVYDALNNGSLDDARKAVSMIVGRDTAELDEAGVTRAAVETVAENTSDGVAAPLICLCLGTSVLGCVYKAVNTMDSMVGYKNDRYMDFGRAAAKLDDGLNYLPSRLCALLMVSAAWLGGMDAGGAWRIWRRDRRNHASPNSAQTEAVMAGALGVQLAGNASYFGVVHEKPTIGDDKRPIVPEDILNSHTLLTMTAVLLMALALFFRGVVYAAI